MSDSNKFLILFSSPFVGAFGFGFLGALFFGNDPRGLYFAVAGLVVVPIFACYYVMETDEKR